MAETAVGVFEEATYAEEVAGVLRENGLSPNSIRVLSKPIGISVDSATSTPSVDFGAALAQDLRSMGATDGEIESYVSSVQSGCALLFVTGTAAEADRAAALMNAHDAVQIEEFAGAVPMLPAVHVGETATGSISLKEDRARARSEGAKVFTW
jgi:hypothetical protein